MPPSVTWKVDLSAQYNATEEIGGRIESVTVPCIATVTGQTSNPIADAIDFANNFANRNVDGCPYIWRSLPFYENQDLRLVARTNIAFAGKNAAGQALVSMDLQYIRKMTEIVEYESATNAFVTAGDVSLSSIKTSKTKRGARPEDSSTDVTLTYAGVTKNGEIDVLEPRANFALRHDKRTINPESISRYMAGSVNDAAWRGYAARQLLCTRVSYKLLAIDDAKSQIYRFEAEFEQSAAPTWDVEIVYRDQQGKIPSDVAWNTSRKLIEYYQAVNFPSLFGTGT
jgi:hypothetical protein